MTIAMLINNVIKATKQQSKQVATKLKNENKQKTKQTKNNKE